MKQIVWQNEAWLKQTNKIYKYIPLRIIPFKDGQNIEQFKINCNEFDGNEPNKCWVWKMYNAFQCANGMRRERWVPKQLLSAVWVFNDVLTENRLAVPAKMKKKLRF